MDCERKVRLEGNARGTGAGTGAGAYRPSFKRIASQTLGPANTKRALLGPAGWDHHQEEEDDDDEEGWYRTLGSRVSNRTPLASGRAPLLLLRGFLAGTGVGGGGGVGVETQAAERVVWVPSHICCQRLRVTWGWARRPRGRGVRTTGLVRCPSG